MKTEVQQRLYEEINGKNPSRFVKCGPSCPVENVSWFEAIEFANALSKKEGRSPCYTIKKPRLGIGKSTVKWDQPNCSGWRLPTEAEWEYAAKANSKTRFAGSSEPKEVAWFAKNSRQITHKPCSKNPNGFGLCDMSGNVREWVWDSWLRSYYDDETDPVFIKKDTDWKVQRGGSWGSYQETLSCSNRYGASAETKGSTTGFRLVRSGN